MKNLWALSFVFFAAAARAGWEADVAVSSAGWTRLRLSDELLDRAAPGLADLRLWRADGSEAPYHLDRGDGRAGEVEDPVEAGQVLAERETVLSLDRPAGADWRALGFVTPPERALKAVTVRHSSDGKKWAVAVDRAPLYRAPGGRETLWIKLPAKCGPRLRVTLDHGKTDPLPVLEVRVRRAWTPPALEDRPVELLGREERDGMTRLHLRFTALRARVEGLTLRGPDPRLARALRLERKVWRDGEIRMERWRDLSDGLAGRFPAPWDADARELVLTVDNRGEAPLDIAGLSARTRPAALVFQSRPGAYRVTVGDPGLPAPAYSMDFLKEAALQSGTPVDHSPLRPAAGSAAPEAAPFWPWTAGDFDGRDWRGRLPLVIDEDGLQRFEPPLAVLSDGDKGGADWRLSVDEKQIPYAVDRTGPPRWVDAAVAEGRAERGWSRWDVTLPDDGLDAREARVELSGAFRERAARWTEERQGPQGPVEAVLVEDRWLSPGRDSFSVRTALRARPEGRRLRLYIQDGDNARVRVTAAAVLVPAPRLLFKARAGSHVEFHYGNPNAAAPRYDLDVDMDALERTPVHDARLAGDAPAPRKALPVPGRAVYWIALLAAAGGMLWALLRVFPDKK